MRKPPHWFVRAIAILDPLLSVRWGTAASKWVVERKAVVPIDELGILKRREARLWRWINTPNPTQKDQLHKNRIAWMSLHEEVESAEAGKRIICMPSVLTQEVYDGLCRSDIKRYGGYARFCEDMESSEERAEVDQERQLSNKRQAMSGEVYDILSFLSRKRETEMHHGYQDMRYLLHGKRTKENDAPLVTLTDF